MLAVRPVRNDDLDAVLALAERSGGGLTTLPNDRENLRRRIRDAVRGFETMGEAPRGGSYLFVMEDLRGHALCGTAGIVSKVGGFDPFYAYEIRVSVHESEALGVRKEVRCLHLVQEHSGPCEIGSLYLAPEFRGREAGRLLSLARFLFMAEHRALFDPIVIAELRGVVDAEGRSPFWDALGRNFFDMDFHRADSLGSDQKRVIADLMPRHPIYIPLLSAEAQAAIGEVHAEARGARRILEAEGFEFSGRVDIFDGGPMLQCAIENIRSIRESGRSAIAAISATPPEGPECILSNTAEDFRAVSGRISTQGDGVVIDRRTALALELTVGDTVRHVRSASG